MVPKQADEILRIIKSEYDMWLPPFFKDYKEREKQCQENNLGRKGKMQLRKRILSFLLATSLVMIPSFNTIGAVSENDISTFSEKDNIVEEGENESEDVGQDFSKEVIEENEGMGIKKEESEEASPDNTQGKNQSNVTISDNTTKDTVVDGKKDNTSDEKYEEEEKKVNTEESEISISVNVLESPNTKEVKNDKKESASMNHNISTDFVVYNTGTKEYVVHKASGFNLKGRDKTFDARGCFTIEIPEKNPFFPYEVQFQYKGEVFTKWFMTPDDCVDIEEYTFYVEADFDGTVITQMNLEAAGKTVVAYPARKNFTNDVANDVAPMSLLPLEEREIVFDFTGLTPLELTMVSVKSMFAGENEVKDTDQILWKYNDYYSSVRGYQANLISDKIDLSYRVTSNYSSSDYYHTTDVEMIVGEKDQLAASNIRYYVDLKMTNPSGWLIPSVFSEDENGNRISTVVGNRSYSDTSTDNKLREFNFGWGLQDTQDGKFYMNLQINKEVFQNIDVSKIKVFEGNFWNPIEATSAKEITEQIFAANMGETGSGYNILPSSQTWITFVSYDYNGNVTGCMPIRLYGSRSSFSIVYSSLKPLEGSRKVVNYSYGNKKVEDYILKEIILYKDEEAYKENYKLSLNYSRNQIKNELITAAFEGSYSTISEAVSKGKENIKELLFSSTGYEGDYKKGVLFTIFVGEDGAAEQEVYKYKVVAKIGDEYYKEPVYNETKSSSTTFNVDSVIDDLGNYVKVIGKSMGNDSYGEDNQYLILVPQGTNLTNLALNFSLGTNAKAYTGGSSTPEVSRESRHDFSKGAVQYTVVAENGKNQKNYWVSIIAANESYGKLYINSFDNPDSKTKVENGIVYSIREVMLDSYHDSIHDIWMANIGNAPIENITVTLESDTVYLDEYWTLYGKYSLAGVPSEEEESSNMAKIRLHKKEDVTRGSAISGTLTIKSGDKVLVVLTLTGNVGDPAITTLEVPNAVKYVPYGTVIQNNNKYSWNDTTYTKYSGQLPKGMEIRENGELYGVPTETGTFTFKVKMNNSYSSFEDDIREFTLVIKQNTDANVDAETDEGYDLRERIQDINNMNTATGTQTMVSEGEYVQFVAIYLDGVALVSGNDYTTEEGSTRITIKNQTLVKNGKGTHTLGIEFRTTDTDTLQCAAQNYDVKAKNSGSGTGSGVGAGNTAPNQQDNNVGTPDGDNQSGNGAGNNNSQGSASGTTYVSTMGQAWNPVTLTVRNNIGSSTNAKNVEIISYTVVAGDTLWKIAKEYLGDPNRWREIAEYNQGAISNPNRIYIGQIILIPVIKQAENNTSDAAMALEGLERTYIVQRGDSLWKISQKLYGSAKYWRKIFDANRDSISSPSRIYVGQILLIPD